MNGLEVLLSIGGILVTVGSIYGMLLQQTKTLKEGHLELKSDVKAIESKVDKCVTRSDFPLLFIREKMASDHDGKGNGR